MGSNRNKIIAAVALFLLAISVPITMSLLQQRQDNRSKASASTTLSFSPATITKTVGETIAVDVMINPGTNIVSYVKFEAKFDPGVLQLHSTTPFVPNTTAFPAPIQSPVISAGSIKAAVSIGSDLTKAVKTPTKVGTLYFTAIGPTNTLSSSLSFGDITEILSISPSDSPIENVLSNTTPATVVVTTASGTPSASPQPSSAQTSPTPTATVTSNPLTPTATPSSILTVIPTASPSTTLTPTITGSSSSIQVNLNVILHGIGIGGDNVNPTAHSFSNKTPVHASHSAIVTLHNAADFIVGAATGTINYSSTSGVFVGSVNLPPVPSGYYLMRVRTENHLTRRVPGILNVTGQTITVPAMQFITGDANDDNTLNILDYNILMGCYGSTPVSCTTAKKVASDFNDDDQVNQIDYNLFLRELSQSFGD